MPKSIRTIAPPGGPRASRKDYDQARGSAASRGYGRRHENWRKLVLHRHPICAIARICGGRAPSTIADHVIPLRSRWLDLTAEQKARVMGFYRAGFAALDPEEALRNYLWSLENGQGSCKPCHEWKTREDARMRAESNGAMLAKLKRAEWER